MNEQEALTRVKTGNFNGGYGFDMQLLVDAVGIIGEMFKSGQISEVVRCKDCVYFDPENAEEGDSYGRCRNNYAPCQNQQVEMMWFCGDGVR